MRSDFTFIAATYLDIVQADADDEALRRLQPHLVSLDHVTIGRKASGEVRFGREPDRRPGPAGRSLPFLAAGLASALFPSIGGDIPTGRTHEREMVNAVAGVVTQALGRAELFEFGALLDPYAAGLIAVTTPADERRARSALTNAHSSMSRPGRVDVDAIEQQLRAIAARHRPSAAP